MTFDAEDQVLIAGDEDWDPSMFGIPAPITGTAVSQVSFKPSRDKEMITGHNKQRLLTVGTNPGFMASVTGKSLLEDSVLNNLAPFQPITRANFANYVDGTRHGMPDTGFFIVSDVGDDAPAGSFRDTKVDLDLITTWTNNVSAVEA